jgi:hypothetical protein
MSSVGTWFTYVRFVGGSALVRVESIGEGDDQRVSIVLAGVPTVAVVHPSQLFRLLVGA